MHWFARRQGRAKQQPATNTGADGRVCAFCSWWGAGMAVMAFKVLLSAP